MAITIASCITIHLFAFQNKPDAFSGKWNRVADNKDTGTPYADFTIYLKINKNVVEGQYCYITHNGSKIDCDNKKNPNIKGNLTKDNHLNVKFSSFFGATGGVANIYRNGDQIVWKVIKKPVGGDFYGPMSSTLSKDNNDSPESGYKITSDKAYFYGEPRDSARSKSYIVKDEIVTLLRPSDDGKFWEIKYTNSRGNILDRWIQCSDISHCTK